MKRALTAVSQPRSAVASVRAAGIRHNDLVNASIVVGVTPATPAKGDIPASLQTAHYCSSRVFDPVLIREGDGAAIPHDGEYQVVNEGGLPEVKRPSLMMFRGLVCANGRLTIKHRTNRALVVPIPYSMEGQMPHAHAAGPMEIAEAYGCKSVQQMFDLHGEVVFVS